MKFYRFAILCTSSSYSCFLLCLVLGLAACNGKQQSNSPTPIPAPDPPQMSKRTRNPNMKLVDANIIEVIPTSDGGAYILSRDDQLWYVRGNNALKVHETTNTNLSFHGTPNSTGSVFAQWVKERKRVKSLEVDKQGLEDMIDELNGELSELRNTKVSGNDN